MTPEEKIKPYETVEPWGVQPEPYIEDEDWRSLYKHDVDEIVYKHAFRKLAQKTQVIVQPSDETFRTRLTHTLEVAQIADNFVSRLGLNRDLARAIAFAHDLGHAPFAHVGEQTLSRLLSQSILRAAVGRGVSRDQAGDITASFSFKHPHNSRRILQRKTVGLSQITLRSVIGHVWSPWKECSTVESEDGVVDLLLRPITDDQRYPGLAHFLPCYEAQAVALSDQIAALNSDVEDLVYLKKDSGPLRNAAVVLLQRLKFDDSTKKRVWKVIEEFITDYSAPLGKQRGWGRKYRLGRAQHSIITSSFNRVSECKSYEESVDKPLAPDPIMAIALDVLERATRNLIYLSAEISERDALAEAATTIMFTRFLALETRHRSDRTDSKERSFIRRMCRDYESWRRDYNSEIPKETMENGAVSLPGMEYAASPVDGLWETVSQAVAVVDYISEMTDRFVIHDVFYGDSLQQVLLENFTGRATIEQ